VGVWPPAPLAREYGRRRSLAVRARSGNPDRFGNPDRRRKPRGYSAARRAPV
jgi:hypothetical protein